MFKTLINIWDSYKKTHGVEVDGSLTTKLFLSEVEKLEIIDTHQYSTVYFIGGERLGVGPLHRIIGNFIFMPRTKYNRDRELRILHYMICRDNDTGFITNRYDIEMYFIPQQGSLYIPHKLVMESYYLDTKDSQQLTMGLSRQEELYATSID